MALLEDVFKGRTLEAAGLGLLALVLPMGISSLRKGSVSVLNEGVKLSLEASGDAEIGLMDSFVEFALDQFVQAWAKLKNEREVRI